MAPITTKRSSNYIDDLPLNLASVVRQAELNIAGSVARSGYPDANKGRPECTRRQPGPMHRPDKCTTPPNKPDQLLRLLSLQIDLIINSKFLEIYI
jgi:hypothetical protein